MKNGIKILGLDADDTLWMNETYYRDTEREFAKLLAGFGDEKEIVEQLFAMEIKNLPLYGYGAKGFVLSMMETALKISKNKLPSETIGKILSLGKTLLNKPVVLLDGVKETLETLHGKYPMILVTKGDLLDQERKLSKSGLLQCFHHIEVMSDKKEEDYRQLLEHLNVPPGEFLMVGNSLKSDVLPLLKLGAQAVHIPYHTTWIHETTDENPYNFPGFFALEKFSQLLKILS